MKLSTRTRYGLQLMFELALNYKKGPTHLGMVSNKENISEKYLGQIVIPLKSSGLIESIRGAQGGYELAHAPEELTVRDIVEVLEGNIRPVEVVENVDCNKGNLCVTNEVWKRLGQSIEDTLQGITLADMLKMYKDKVSQGYTYSI